MSDTNRRDKKKAKVHGIDAHVDPFFAPVGNSDCQMPNW